MFGEAVRFEGSRSAGGTIEVHLAGRVHVDKAEVLEAGVRADKLEEAFEARVVVRPRVRVRDDRRFLPVSDRHDFAVPPFGPAA